MITTKTTNFLQNKLLCIARISLLLFVSIGIIRLYPVDLYQHVCIAILMMWKLYPRWMSVSSKKQLKKLDMEEKKTILCEQKCLFLPFCGVRILALIELGRCFKLWEYFGYVWNLTVFCWSTGHVADRYTHPIYLINHIFIRLHSKGQISTGTYVYQEDGVFLWSKTSFSSLFLNG